MAVLIRSRFKKITVDIVCLLYILLFVYAALSKLLDFERFEVQLAQSPLLSAFASFISGSVIVIELIAAVLLMFTQTRSVGLYISLSLMSMFSVYIFIILNYSSFIPCSCGGILEKMDWNSHLIFNLFFVALAVTAILLQSTLRKNGNQALKRRRNFKRIAISIFSSVLLIIILFISSEEIIHKNNPLIRRYPHNLVRPQRAVELNYNSYYLSGASDEKIYLGNYTDPLHLLEIDTLNNKKNIQITFHNRDLPFQTVGIEMRGDYFYLMDGTVPCVFRGDVKDWKITKRLDKIPGFTALRPIDSNTVVLRNNRGEKRANILGVFQGGTQLSGRYSPELLKAQIDGIFDTDGLLLYNEDLKRIIYVYYYRNQFISAEKSGELISEGRTIDTISHAKIKVGYLKQGRERQMAAPAYKVNSTAATMANLLLVHSMVQGQYDSDNLWKQSSIIDVYNLKNNSYLFSFSIPDENGNKIKNLMMTKTHLYAVAGTELKIYKLSGLLKEQMNN